MPTEPVLVIHGVANRSKDAFARQVRAVGRRLERDVAWLDVYWGDLGARHAHLDRVLPPVLELPTPWSTEGIVGADVPVADASAALVIAAAELEMRGLNEGVGVGLSPQEAEAVRVAWGETAHLQRIDDPRALEAVGRMVAATIRPADATEGLITDVVGTVRRLLNPLDDLVAALGGRAAGALNQALRGAIVPELAKFLGDVFVYQRDRAAIQRRIWDRLSAQERWPGLGRSPDTAVIVVAHSLGGVVAFDTAVAGSPRLFVKAFVTFGSQAPFFHLIDPRDGTDSEHLPAYTGRRKLTVSSIRRWINLYEPMDPLAFIAGNIFRLGSSGGIDDRIIEHRPQAGLYTHSDYWEHPGLDRAIGEALDNTR